MDELRKNIRSVMTKIVKIYEERLNNAKEEIDGTELISQHFLGANSECMEQVEKVDMFLTEFKEREAKKTKKGWF